MRNGKGYKRRYRRRKKTYGRGMSSVKANRAGRRATQSIIRAPSAISDRMLVKLRYSEQINQASNLGVINTYIWRGNGIYDPNYSGTGHQPLGRDEWANFYNKCLVKGCSIKATFINNSTGPMHIGLLAKTSPSATASFDTIRERGINKHGTISALTTAGYRKTLKMYQNTAKMFAMKPGDLTTSNSDYVQNVGSNPNSAFQWLYQTIVQSVDGTSTLDCNVVVELTYYVTFCDRKILTES